MIGVAGCGDAAPRTAEAFCGELRAHTTEITALPQTAAEIPALITLYSKMDEVAPLTIQHSWEQLYGSLKTATTVNPADPASVQKAADAAYAAQPAATALVTWAQQTCGLTLGPVAGIPGGASVDTTPITTPPTVTG
ncbi:MAG TPA: hypothetical protein VGM78_03075 [Ilumatobacteraceae bacterium]